MKTLAVIKNELFKDFLKIVSTDDLANTLDNPDVPLPYECLDSVENNNSDILATQLSQFFSHAKLPNKDFYRLDDNQASQLTFMLNLIKLSSQGHPQVRVGRLPENATLAPLDYNIDEESNNNSMPSQEFVGEAPAVLQETLPQAHFEDSNDENHTVALDYEETKAQLEAIENTVHPTVEESTTPVQKSITPAIENDKVQLVEKDEPPVAKNELHDTAKETPQLVEKEVTEHTNDKKEFVKDIKTALRRLPEVNIFSDVKEDFDPFANKQETSPIITLEAPVEYVYEDLEAPSKNQDISVEDEDPFKFVPTETVKKEVVEAPVVNAIISEKEVSNKVEAYGLEKGTVLHFSKNAEITAKLIDENTVEFDNQTLSLNDAAKSAFKKAGGMGLPNGLNNWLYNGMTLKQLKENN